MVHYYAICGSRSHGIELPNSDYDVVYCGDETPALLRERSHNIVFDSAGLIYRLFLQYTIPHYLQVYFPAEIIQNTDVMRYILAHRDEILAARAKRIYESYMLCCEMLPLRPEWYHRWVKDAVYSCMYYNILHQYATRDVPFSELWKPQGDFKEWLMAVRREEIGRDEVMRVYSEQKAKAIGCAGFYENRTNLFVLNQSLSDLNDLLGTSVEMTF